MSDDLTNTLGWVANYSSFYSVVTVLICFICMVVFILRLNGDLLLSSTATHHRVVEEQHMLGLTNPFSVHLQKGKTSSLTAGVYLEVMVLDITLLTAVWGVNIQAFQQELNLSSSEIWERYKDKMMFGGRYMEYQDCGQFVPDGKNNTLYIECPTSVTEAALGEPPRSVYPIIIVTVRENPQISLEYTAVVLLFTVLHLKDSMCSLDSHIVYQFLKTNHSQTLSLQPIFVSATDLDKDSQQVQSQTSFNDKSISDQPNDKLVTSKQISCHEDKNSRNLSEFQGENKQTSSRRGTDTALRRTSRETLASANANISSEIDTSSLDKLNSNKTLSADELDSDRCFSSGMLDSSFTNAESSPEVENSDALKEEYNLCVVCQNAPIFYTLLSCRHACVCYLCIKLLDRCPMCRGFIDSYFRLKNVPDPVLPDNSSEECPEPRLPWWETLNIRLNHMLGFD